MKVTVEELLTKVRKHHLADVSNDREFRALLESEMKNKFGEAYDEHEAWRFAQQLLKIAKAGKSYDVALKVFRSSIDGSLMEGLDDLGDEEDQKESLVRLEKFLEESDIEVLGSTFVGNAGERKVIIDLEPNGGNIIVDHDGDISLNDPLNVVATKEFDPDDLLIELNKVGLA